MGVKLKYLFLLFILYVSTGFYNQFFPSGKLAKIKLTSAEFKQIENNLQVGDYRIKRQDYRRENFGAAWSDDSDNIFSHNSCSTREDILNRDLYNTAAISAKGCGHKIVSGKLFDPYSNKLITFKRGDSNNIEIDHIVPLSYAWDRGAWNWNFSKRLKFANDPTNLVAVSKAYNQDKSDQGIGNWLPTNKNFVCLYVWQFIKLVVNYGLSLDYASKLTWDKLKNKCFSFR